jgi:hypothetical protein
VYIALCSTRRSIQEKGMGKNHESVIASPAIGCMEIGNQLCGVMPMAIALEEDLENQDER